MDLTNWTLDVNFFLVVAAFFSLRLPGLGCHIAPHSLAVGTPLALVPCSFSGASLGLMEHNLGAHVIAMRKAGPFCRLALT